MHLFIFSLICRGGGGGTEEVVISNSIKGKKWYPSWEEDQVPEYH
jgi:hypothetical protein